MIRRRFFGLCLPPLLLCLLDGTLTLFGQSSEYWSGHYLRANEANPTYDALMQTHPAAFAATIAAVAVAYVVVILLLPPALALMASIALTLGHAAGAATWVLYRFQFGYQACNGLFLLTAILLGACIRWGWLAEAQLPDPAAKTPWLLRWGIVALLVGAIAYLSFVRR